jgi:hypothetical protein
VDTVSLFSADSIWTMLHGIALGGGTLLALAAALFALTCMGTGGGAADRGAADRLMLSEADARRAGYVALLLVGIAVLAWFTVIGGTYIVFPSYRIAPPEGATDLSEYPRALLLASGDTAWLHRYAMETKEHVPWIAAILATAAAFVGVRNRPRLLSNGRVRQVVTGLTAAVFVIVAYVSLLGVFVNKVAPLD